MRGRLCCRLERVAVAEASGMGPLVRLADSDRRRSIDPQLRQLQLVPGFGPWCMDHTCEATARDHRRLHFPMLDWLDGACDSRRQSCRFRDTDYFHFRIERGAAGR